jgi:DNA primase
MSQWVDFRALKQGLSIEQVLALYRIALERVGHNQRRGHCPLPTHRSEQSRESFSVDTTKNVWACHSASCCEARQRRVGGNVLDLVALLERCTIRDAALRLQDRRCGWRDGIHLREQQLASKGSSRSRSWDQLPPLTFSLGLRWHPYLEQRGVHRSTAARFGVGYYGESGFLQHRIVFPIHDSEGRPVAYAGRSVDGSEPRYLFPPGFRKSQVVFNLPRAMREAAECAIVVEGFFDCLRVHQAGCRNVVALMGVSLSEMQEKMLLERFPQLVLMLDGDEAGRRASHQLVERLARKVSVAMIEVADGRQPDQLSSEEVQGVLHSANAHRT